MSFFKVNTESAAKVEGGNFINQSGIYDVTIKAIIVDTNGKGARSLNFYIDNNGTEQVIYGGLQLDNNDGSANFQANTFNKLCVVAELEAIQDPVEATLPIGKAGAAKDVAVLPDFEEFDCKMRVQMEYTVVPDADKNGKPYAKAGQISERKLIKAFYSTDGAEASEILNKTEPGIKLAKDLVYAENVTYKDGLTAEAIAAWIAGGRDASATPTNATPTPKASFGKREFGKK